MIGSQEELDYAIMARIYEDRGYEMTHNDMALACRYPWYTPENPGRAYEIWGALDDETKETILDNARMIRESLDDRIEVTIEFRHPKLKPWSDNDHVDLRSLGDQIP